ncbi:MAG: hypothetical protein LBL56_03905 [Treponema sp.]|jgi:hypothetical protein|nr:hypothetical protein [Treponema sp.]
MIHYKAALGRVLLFLAFAGAVFLPASCALEADPLEGGGGLDERLYGVWRFEYGRIVEEIRITREPHNPGNLGALVAGGAIWEDIGFQENFAGDIVYAENFSESGGIIIIEYWPEHEQVWVDWSKAEPPDYFPPRKDSPTGRFYGIYFLNMNEEGTQVFLAFTNDQNNRYGPTETETLEEAIAKFTTGNMNQMLDLSVGDPQHKVKNL